MRIDIENNVVWCNEHDMEWYVSFQLSYGNSLISNLLRIHDLSSEIDEDLPTKMHVFGKLCLIRAISSNFEFKLEKPKKYHWRKKKEHLAWFERVDDSYLVRFKFSNEIDHSYTLGEIGSVPVEMTEQEAKELMKDDFDKFEKVVIN